MNYNVKELIKEITIAASAQKNGNIIPILDNLLFSEVGGKLVIIGTDLEVTTVVSTNFLAPTDLSVALDNKTLLDLLKNINDDTVDLHFGKTITKIHTMKGDYEIASWDGGDFPAMPKTEAINSITIKGKTMLDVIETTVHATSADELRPVMTGVLFDIKADGLVFVATNGHKLVKKEYKGASFGEPVQLIVPKKPLIAISKGISETVVIGWTEVNVSFESGNVKTYGRLVEGKYPPYERVIPVDQPFKLTIGKADFLSALKRVGLFANRSSRTVKLNLTETEVKVSAQDLDFNNSAEEIVSARYKGDPLEIGFNGKYIVEIIESVDGSLLDIKFSENSKPAIVTSPSQEDFLGLVMPMAV